MTTSEAALVAVDPRTAEPLATYPETPVSDVPTLVDAAVAAFADPRLADPARRAHALRAAAGSLRAAGDELRELCGAESGLPAGRVAGELERTCVQLELFAEAILGGDHLEAIIDRADSDAKPAPRPDLRRMLVPTGPVVVFGASNFPLAFGVAGGDTAAALAAGCPVIAKGHPSQPGVNELVGRCLAEAVSDADLPGGAFAIAQGAAQELGEALVDAEAVCAVAFTGSTAGGRALYDRAARRPRPIPVFAEMGSVNPAVLTAAALRARSDRIAEALLVAVTGAAGQLCTKPGVVLVPEGAEGDEFVRAFVSALDESEPGVMLNARLRDGFAESLEGMGAQPGVELLSTARRAEGLGFHPAPAAFTVDAATVAQRPEVRDECFGPAVLLARYADEPDLLAALEAFEGQLAAAVFAETEDEPLVGRLTTLLTARVGRLVFDAFPTGVAVSWAMQHGGPYPATTAPDHTSVGLTSTRRFMRPVCWQSAPEHALPSALRDENPTGIWRRVDGLLTSEPLQAGSA
jgi:acyl-CoA reductase-like NAD-dependent aldehyde dehydrogenase